MRNFIDIISKGLTETLTESTSAPAVEETVLLEGKHFEAMFGAAESLAQRYKQNDLSAELADAKNIVKALKRNDRQAWAARLLRLWLFDNMVTWTLNQFEGMDADPLNGTHQADPMRTNKQATFEQFKSEVSRLDAKYRAEYLKMFGVAWDQEPQRTNIPSLIKRNILGHYLGMTYSKIQNYVFGKSIAETMKDLAALEEEFKQRTKALLPLHEGDQIIIRMPDNYVWVLLDRGYCGEEASAMGHCGNAGAKPGDRILSLRRIKDVVDGVTYMEVFLTFILNEDGKLGEMKGRGNDKPAARYHPQIIELLKNPIVKGIRGGGWLPKNNFHLNDLPEDVRAKLLDEHPHLGGWVSRYQRAEKEGTVDQLIPQLVAAVKESNSWTDKAKLDEDTGDIVAYEWESVDELVDEMSDDEHTKEISNGDWRADYDHTPDDNSVEGLIDSLPLQWQIALGKRAHELYLDAGDPDDEDDFDPSSSREVRQALEDNGDENYMHLQHAVLTGEEYGAEHEAHKALEQAIKDFTPRMGHMVFSTWERDGETGWAWDSPVKLAFTPKEAADFLDEFSDDDNEYEYSDDRELKSLFAEGNGGRHDGELKVDVPYYGWQDYDQDAAIDRFMEESDLDTSDFERKPDPAPDFDNMPAAEVKQWIETMYAKIPDGFIRKVHTDTLTDDKLRASAKGLFIKYYG